MSRKTFVSNALVNAGGIAAGQFLVLLATPVLARQYAPAEFGIYASLVAVSSVIGVGSSLRFDIAVPSTTDGETPSVYRLGLLACGASLLFGMLAAGLGLHRLMPWPTPLATTALALLSAACGTLQAVTMVATAALVRRGCFRRIALVRIVQPLSFVVAALLGISGGLPAAFAISLAVTAVCSLAFSWRDMMQPAALQLKQAARKYWEYPVISLPVAMLDTLTLQLPLLFIVQTYGEAAAGNYSQVQRLAAAPLILCASAIAQVFYKHAGDVVRAGGSARPLMWRTVRGLAMFGAVMIVLVAAFGEPVLSLFLGKNWRTDSYYLLLVLLPAVFRVTVSPITSIFLLTGQMRLGALWQALYAATTWTLLRYASTRYPLDDLLLAILVNELVVYAIYLWMADIAVRRIKGKVIQCAA